MRPPIAKGFELPLVIAEEDELGAQLHPAAHGAQRRDWEKAHLVDQEPGVRERRVEVKQVRHRLSADQAARAVRVGAHADLLLKPFQDGFDLLEQDGFSRAGGAKAEHALVEDCVGCNPKRGVGHRRQAFFYICNEAVVDLLPLLRLYI